MGHPSRYVLAGYNAEVSSAQLNFNRRSDGVFDLYLNRFHDRQRNLITKNEGAKEFDEKVVNFDTRVRVVRVFYDGPYKQKV